MGNGMASKLIAVVCLTLTTSFFQQDCSSRAEPALTYRVDFARYLLTHGATVGRLDNTGSVFALMLAAESVSLEVCRLLVEEWAAEVNQQATDGTTPLLGSSSEGRLDLIYLIDHGAEVQHTDAEGYNSLMHAVNNGKTEVARHLLTKGASTDQVGTDDSKTTTNSSSRCDSGTDNERELRLTNNRTDPAAAEQRAHKAISEAQMIRDKVPTKPWNTKSAMENSDKVSTVKLTTFITRKGEGNCRFRGLPIAKTQQQMEDELSPMHVKSSHLSTDKMTTLKKGTDITEITNRILPNFILLFSNYL
ncbi:hypothetical protein niasHT_032236 [Heterodera trifolii]|uniref:Uncharacterized protein n=1 Tax=Heterodera trifolii TaxID=157864 RepID=A0ABD2HUA5_9BILA